MSRYVRRPLDSVHQDEKWLGPRIVQGSFEPPLPPVEDPPPPSSRARFLVTIAAAWVAAPVLLWTNGFTIPETSANVPCDRQWVSTVNEAWEPAQWLAQRARAVPQESIAPAEDAPPPRKPAAASWGVEHWDAQSARHTPQVAAAAADNPPTGYRPWLRTALDSWAPSPVILWTNGFLATDGPAAADSPVPTHAWMPRVVALWEAPTWQAQTVRHFRESGAAPPVDAPIPSRRWVARVVSEWEQELVPLWGAVGVQQTDAVPGVRYWITIALRSWEPDSWSAQSARGFTQGTAAQVDAPVPQRDLRVHLWWDAPAWEAQSSHGFTEGTSAQVDAPIPQRDPRVHLWWWDAPSWDAQSAHGFTQGTAAPADAPAPRRRLQPPWDAELWGAQSARYTPQSAPAADVPLAARRAQLYTIREAWEPQQARTPERQLAVQPYVPDNPPLGIGRRIWLILPAWEPGPVRPQGWAWVMQGSPLVYSDRPLRARIGSEQAGDPHKRIGSDTASDENKRIGSETAGDTHKRIGTDEA